jgi:hypothetical protein
MLRVVDANIRWQAANYVEIADWLDTVVPANTKSILFRGHQKPAATVSYNSNFETYKSYVLHDMPVEVM